MTTIFRVFPLLLWGSVMSQVSPTDDTSFRLYLGSGIAPDGFIYIPPACVYTDQEGIGYDFGTRPQTGGPFFLSFRVPEGNYRVRVTLGDSNGPSSTVVKAESRRLMVKETGTPSGRFETRSFVVNVRTPLLPGGDRVRLKPREHGHLNWDDKLTLEFNGTRPRVDTVEVDKVDLVPTVFLAGDSTVTDQREEPWSAWGQMLPCFFKDDVAIANHAESGESLKSFAGEKRLQKVLSQMRAGDYLFIQFGHNDQKETGPGIGPFTSYKASLKSFITETRKRGAQPVLVTSMFRRRFDESGKIIDTMAKYPDAVRQVAAEEKVPLIDLNSMSRILFEAMGSEGSKKAFVHYPAGTFPGQKEKIEDDSHFSTYGAYQLACCVAEGIKSNVHALAGHLVDGIVSYDPAHPDPYEEWALPPSPIANPQAPEGN